MSLSRHPAVNVCLNLCILNLSIKNGMISFIQVNAFLHSLSIGIKRFEVSIFGVVK